MTFSTFVDRRYNFVRKITGCELKGLIPITNTESTVELVFASLEPISSKGQYVVETHPARLRF